MLETLRNAWKIEELRKKILYTFMMLVLFRLVGVIPAPGVDVAKVMSQNNTSTLPLLEKKIIRKELDGVKILGGGELTKKLTVKAAKFSGSAKEKIEAVGGKAEVI